MARIRTIKPEFWQNEHLASVSEHARLLAIALLNHSDDKGYFLANPALVRSACFPFEENSEKVRGSLQELSGIGYIEVRNCGGKAIGSICKFLDHQRIDKPQKSKLAAVFESASAENPTEDGENGDSRNIPGTVAEASKTGQRPERNREQGTGKGTVFCPEADEPPSGPKFDPSLVMFPEFPCSGPEGSQTWQATELQLSEWAEAYPAVNVTNEMRKAHAWIKANLGKRKTKGGMPKFITSWLARAQDAPGKSNGQHSPPPVSKPLPLMPPRVAR